jgi:hypothetical protein
MELMQIPGDAVLSRFDWRSEESDASLGVIREPFEVARAHLIEIVDDMQDNLVER